VIDNKKEGKKNTGLTGGGQEKMVVMMMQKSSLDLVLVPCGLVIMFGYHLILLYRILRRPAATVIGYENHNKLAWVRRMVQVNHPPPAAGDMEQLNFL
jgi:hypothetical protein